MRDQESGVYRVNGKSREASAATTQHGDSDQPKRKTAFLPEVGFLRLPQILAIYPVGRSTWWAGVKAGKFPRPVKLGPRITAWRVEDIRTLLAVAGRVDEHARTSF